MAKWYNNEELTEKALLIRDNFVDGTMELCAPEQLVYEVGNSIWKNKAFTVDECVQAIKSLIELEIELVRADGSMAARAMQTAMELGVSFYDAVYVQLALDRRITLLSADSQLLSKSEKKLRGRGRSLDDL